MATATRFLRRPALLVAVGILAAVLTGCTGRGGGYLPPNGPLFTGPASLGFDFSCEDKGGVNPPTGRLDIQLAYADKGSNLLGAPFSIHGIVDLVDPVVESAVCIGQNPPPDGSELIFLGRYRLTSTPPAGFPLTCPARDRDGAALCRFEVIVRDNDGSLAPSPGDFFSIKLSSATSCVDAECSGLPVGTVFYARAGFLQGGNITVK